MSFSTKILNPEGKEVSYTMVEKRPGFIYLIEGEYNLLGTVSYKIKNDCVYINFIENMTLKNQNPYRYVGSSLIGILFVKSLEAGKKGRIEFNSLPEAAPIYFKMGFRFIDSSKLAIEHLVDDYFRCDPNDRINYAIKIKNHKDFKRLRKQAAKYLHKKIDEVSYLEAMQYGFHCRKNEDMQNALSKLAKGEKLGEETCKRNSFLGPMYLPSHTIELKQNELFLSNSTAVNSTTTSPRARLAFFPLDAKKPLPSTPLMPLEGIDRPPKKETTNSPSRRSFIKFT